eukprot:scaffold1210_cov214-Skeletonema_marinoi.AAC.4
MDEGRVSGILRTTSYPENNINSSVDICTWDMGTYRGPWDGMRSAMDFRAGFGKNQTDLFKKV